MPTAIAAAISIATAVGSFITAGALVGVAAAIVGAIVIVGTVALATKAIKKRQQAKINAATQIGSTIASALVTKTGSSVPIPLVYGERRMSGQRVFLGSDGDKNKYLHIIESLTEGPIEGISKVYFNDELAATSSDNGASFTWESNYDTFAQILFKDGTQTAALNSETLSLDGDSVSIHADWAGSTKVGNNTSYVYMVMKFDQDKFGSGLPNITFTLKGKKVPAIGSAYDSTLSYSNEPAHIIYDYMVNPNYGKGIPHTLLDTTSFNAAASYNNQQVDKSSTDTTQVTRYTCDAYLDTAASMLENLESLLTTMRGGIITGDRYKLIQDKPKSISNLVHINDDRIVGSIKYLQANKKTLINGLRAKFPDKEGDFNYQENITIVDSPTLQSSSNDGVKLQQDIELEHTTNKEAVERILTEEINQSRQSGILEVEIDPRNIDLTVGDVVKFSNTTLGQTEKLYRITKTVLKPTHTLELNMREYDPNVYWDNNKSIIVNNKDDTDH